MVKKTKSRDREEKKKYEKKSTKEGKEEGWNRLKVNRDKKE